MGNRCNVRRAVAAITAFVLALGGGAAAIAAPPASLGGTILSGDLRGPLPGARLHAVDAETGASFVSEPTGPGGAFRVQPLPAGSYRLAIESAGGLYAVGETVILAAGEQLLLNLAVKGPPVPPVQDPGELARKRPSAWNNPGTATGIVIGIAIILGYLFDETTDTESVASEVAL